MWPHSFTVAGVEDGFDLIAGQDNLDYLTHCICREITRSIGHYVRFDLSTEGYFLPAQALYNHFENPSWGGLGAGYGIGQTREALEHTKAALKLLKKARHPKNRDSEVGSIYREYAIQRLGKLPYPATIYIKNALKQPEHFEEFVVQLDDLYRAYLPQLEKVGGNVQAKRIAMGLRVVFEFTATPLKAGSYLDQPSGDYCKCLHEIYSIVGIECGARYYADDAKKANVTKNEDYIHFKRVLTEIFRQYELTPI